MSPWPHHMLGNCGNFSTLQCWVYTSLPHRLWNTCQLMLIHSLTHVPTTINSTTDRHPEAKNPYYFNSNREDKNLSPQQVAASKPEMCLPTVYRGWVLSWLPSGLWFFLLNHHYHIPKETGRVLSHGSVGCITGPVSPLERHQAWQFRKAQGWTERACTYQEWTAILWFRPHNDHLTQIPRKSCSFMYR